MPLKERRILSATRTCERPGCGGVFHPWRGREQGEHAQRYCSHACSRAAGVFAVTGAWPNPHVAARTRQPPLTTEGDTLPPGTSRTAPPPMPSSPARQASLDTVPMGRLWREAGVRWQARADATLARAARTTDSRALVLCGYGASLSLHNGALMVRQGATHSMAGGVPHETLYPALHNVAELIRLDCNGSVSLSALAWCRAEGIAVRLFDRDGNLLAETPATPDRVRDDVALRRRQYTLSPDAQTAIACAVLRRKLEGQRGTLATLAQHREVLASEAPASLAACAAALETLDNTLAWLNLPTPPPWLCGAAGLGMLRTYEAHAAKRYFAALEGLPLRWATADTRRIPPHWLIVGPRTSPLAPNGNARRAVRPAQALWNYAYRCLESQTRQALTSAGFDIACGLSHSDKPGRDSLVYDAMELERGAVDALVLRFIGQTTFRAADFTRVSDGSVRLHPQLARAVVATCHMPHRRIDEDAKWLRSAVLSGLSKEVSTQSQGIPTSVRVARECSAVV